MDKVYKKPNKLNESLPVIQDEFFFKTIIKDIEDNYDKGLENCQKLQDFVSKGQINFLTPYGNHLLNLYVESTSPKLEVVDFLLFHGANIRKRNKYFECVICQSIKTKQSFDFIEGLLEKGAYINPEYESANKTSQLLRKLIEDNPKYQDVFKINKKVSDRNKTFLPFEVRGGFDIKETIKYIEENIKKYGIDDYWTKNIDWNFINIGNVRLEKYQNIFMEILDCIKNKSTSLTGDDVVKLSLLGNVNQQDIFGKNLAMNILTHNISNHYYVSKKNIKNLLNRTNLKQISQRGYGVFDELINSMEFYPVGQPMFDFSTQEIRNFLDKVDVNNIDLDGRSTASQIVISNKKLGLDKQDYWNMVKNYNFLLDKSNDFVINSIIYKNNFNLTYDELKQVFMNNDWLLKAENINNILHVCFNDIQFKKQDLEFLFKLGADVNSQDNEDKTILMKAIENKEKHFLFDLIIEQEPDLLLVDKNNLNSYDYAQKFFPDFNLIYDYHKINYSTTSNKKQNNKKLL